MKHDETLSAYHFYVEIDGIETARFQKCVGLEAETFVFEIEEGGYGIRKFPGRTRFPNIILEKGITENNELLKWYKATVLEGRTIERKNGSVVLKDLSGKEIKRWNFFRALPCRWTGPRLDANRRGEYAVERIEIAHEGLEVDNDLADNFPFHVGRDMNGTQDFVFDIDSREVVPQNSNVVPEHQTPTNPNQVHCDIYAWNAALDNGLDPRGQNGEEWDGNRLTVNQIYDLYPNNRNDLPPANSRGFAFYDGANSDNDDPTHMEFYDNTNENNDTYIRHGTDGIAPPVQTERDINLPANGNWVYIPLDDLN